MKCIKCEGELGGELEAKLINGVMIEQCNQCCGLWFDIGELDWLLSVPQLALPVTSKGNNSEFNIQRAHCPRCGGVGHMIQLHRMQDDIYVDACPSCSGRWLDGGEIELLRKEQQQQAFRSLINRALTF
ncbi:MAG: zf-TFIIB domain-containing protein [Planctomycetes bacterium]|nr:zf-TFIIB domain-containing protein [Planctomycetota bacterium]